MKVEKGEIMDAQALGSIYTLKSESTHCFFRSYNMNNYVAQMMY